MSRVINWFEIPAADFERAVRFYEAVFGVTLKREDMNGMQFAVFPYEPPGPSGAVCKMSHLSPGAEGTIVYLDAGVDVTPVLERATANGGKVVMEKMLVSEEIGHIGMFIDTEGNRVGVHAAP